MPFIINPAPVPPVSTEPTVNGSVTVLAGVIHVTRSLFLGISIVQFVKAYPLVCCGSLPLTVVPVIDVTVNSSDFVNVPPNSDKHLTRSPIATAGIALQLLLGYPSL